MQRGPLAVLTLLLGLALIPACSGGHGPASPVTPSPERPSAAELPTAGPAPANAAPIEFPTVSEMLPIGLDVSSRTESGESALGLFGLTVDAKTLQATLEPLVRNGQLGEDFEVDVTDFFRKSPCKDCLEVTGLSLDPSGNVLVDVAARHPFAVPPPGAGRLDLHVFDMTLQAFMKGDQGDPGFTIFSDLDVKRSTTSTSNLKINRPGLVLNASGFSAGLDNVIDDIYDTGATAHPYILMKVEDVVPGAYNPATTSDFTDLSNPQGYNVFGMGQSATGQFVFDFNGADQVGLVLALDAKYGVSARGNIPVGQPGNRRSPRYFLPEFNRKEAWRVQLNVLSNTLVDDQTTSTAQIEVAINDWQQAVGTVSPGYDFFTAPLDSLGESSDVAMVSLSAPDLLNAPLNQTVAASGDGSIASPLVYNFILPNTRLATAGEHWAAVAVRDQLRTTTGGTNGGVERDGTTFFDLADYSTYQVVSLTVATGNDPPACNLVSTPPSSTTVASGTTVQCDGSGTTDDADPLGSLTFEWDTNYNGVTFIPTPAFTTPVINVQLINASAGNVNRVIAMRVTDTDGASCTPVSTVTFTVQPNTPPTCVLISNPLPGTVNTGTNVQLNGSGSFDSEDAPASLTFEWDTNYDNVTFVPTAGFTTSVVNVTVTNATPAPIQRRLGMRVTDTSGGGCISSVLFTVNANQKPIARITRPGTPAQQGTGIWGPFAPYPNTTDTVPMYLNRTATLDYSGAASSDPDGTVTAWDWDYENVNANPADFGAGFTSDQNIQDPAAHAYITYGSTYVCLRVTDNLGAVGYLRREVTVTPFSAQVLGDPTSVVGVSFWQVQHTRTGTPISRVGSSVLIGGEGSNPTGTVTFAGTFLSTNAGASFSNAAEIDRSLRNSGGGTGGSNGCRSTALDMGDGLLPYTAYMYDNLVAGTAFNLYFKKATASSGANMWASNPGSGGRALITTGAAQGWTNPSMIEMAVRPGNPDQVVVGVITNVGSGGGLAFFKSANATNGATSTWTQLTGVFLPLAGVGGAFLSLDMAMDTAGDCHVMWHEQQAGADRVRYAQFSTAGTGSAYGNQDISTSTGAQGARDPQLWVDTTDRPLVVWSDDKAGGTNGYDIYIRRGNNANVPTFSAELKVNNDLTSRGVAGNRDQFHPSVCVDGASNIWVVWEDKRENSGVSNAEVYTRVYDGSFATLVSDVTANNYDPYNLVDDATPWIVTDRTTPASGANAVTTLWTGDFFGGSDDLMLSRGTLQ
ncbi:MAG: hypothetical protein ABI743_01375 [bacterium]